MHTWFERLLNQIRNHKGPVVLVGDDQWGAPYLIEKLDEPERPLIWLALSERDAGDEIAQGNKLVDALRHAMQVKLFGYGLPYPYGLSVLRSHLDLLGPFVFALSGAEHSPELAEELCTIGRDNLSVFSFAQPPETVLPKDALVLCPDDLKLRVEEAKAFAQNQLPDDDVTELLAAAGGAYEAFEVALRHRLGQRTLFRPTPEGPRFPENQKARVEAEALLKALTNRGRWLEALELSVEVLPQAASEVLDEAGHYFHERGLHQRLWETLKKLPAPARDSTVLFWQLSAASRIGRAETMREAVEAQLSAHPEAGALRALYAGTLASASRTLEEAKRAVETNRTAFTLYQYGRALAHENPQAGEVVLWEAVTLAETAGRPYELVRNSWALAARLTALGRYHEGVSWARWAVETYETSSRMGDLHFWLLSVNEWAFGRILIGNLEGLEALLLELETHLDRVATPLAQLFRSTIADFYLASGAPEQAYAYYLKNWQGAARAQLGDEARTLVRALLELERFDEALDVARKAYHLTKGDSRLETWSAQLAYGMALSFTHPEEALTHLEDVWRALQAPLAAIPLAQAGLYLAMVQLRLGNETEALGALSAAEPGLCELSESGLALLAGPEWAFHGVRKHIGIHRDTLELSLLGRSQVWLDGRLLELPLRHLEVLCLLALYPFGLSGEEFMLLLYGEMEQRSTLKATISKLRRYIPIGTQPYRLPVPFKADFIELKAYLDQGRVREAVGLYKGTLLPQSEAPGIIENREALEEIVRQAVLSSDDEDALLALAEILGEDLEVWERTLHILPTSDPRSSRVQARVKSIRKAWAVDAWADSAQK